jgi:hypothetical protein
MYMPMGVDNAWDFDDWTGHFEIQVRGERLLRVLLHKAQQ